jgi:hypothetical protein
MEVAEPGNLHIETCSDDSVIRVMLSKSWIEIYREIHTKLIETGILSIELDFLEELADRLIGFLSIDLGPVSVSVGLLALALYELCDKLTVTRYEITRTPAVFGKAVLGKTRLGQGGYTIEPVDLD